MEAIEITEITPEQMKAQGWEIAGTTDDRTILREIKRDYRARGFRVAFTHHRLGRVAYWISPLETTKGGTP